jgi:Ecdysteroid kinase-like family
MRSTQVGTGQIGKCIRYELDVGAAPVAVPRSLIGKFPSDDAQSRGTGVALRNYYREVNFYRELAARLQISTPRCYFAAIDGDGPEFALLLEDLAPARQGDQLAGCSLDVARSAVLQLVGLQAPSWCDATLKRRDWLWQDAVPADAMIAMYGRLLPGFIDRYGVSLAADERDIIERVARSPGCPLFEPVGSPFCLEHVDYRLDNLLIDEAVAPPRVTVVDWQSIRVGKPFNDVAYFLGASLLPELRRDAERSILRDYVAALARAGVGLTWQDCWDGYRRGAFAGFGVTVIASMLVQQTPRGDEMFIAMARRHARHALDVGALEWLE